MKRKTALVRYAISLGYEIVRVNGHVHLRHAVTGARRTLPGTPGSHRADKNDRAALRRGARQEDNR